VGGVEIVCFATQGSGSSDEIRIAELLKELEPRVLSFDRSAKRSTGAGLLREIRRLRPALVVMEGTGLTGGLVVIVARLINGVPYVVSSGDAVGPFIKMHHPRVSLFAHAYERLLWRLSAGCIAWSPYLAGRALTLGAPLAMTAANWAPPHVSRANREEVRAKLGIPSDAIVFGIAGSLVWNDRVGYCYGHELVRAILQTDRRDLRVLIVGDGTGHPELTRLAGNDLGQRVILVGRVARQDVDAHLCAMDVASLPQSVDQVGAFRYTAKLSEYLAAGLPIVTGQIPLAYDLDDGWLWRLPGVSPWDQWYVDALSDLMTTIDRTLIEARAALVPRESPTFSKERQQRQVAEFIRDIIRNDLARTRAQQQRTR